MTSVQRNVVDVLPNNLGDSKELLTHVDAREISVPAERQKFENFTEEKFQSFYQSAAINIEVINVFHENQDAVSIFVNGNLTSLTGYKTDVIQDF
ncbi:hypothetical protein RirG_196160 [Rhizophagus irregularis DAOM 197198w]|uniref:Uncharacterized protein n=1 Tax=Rhizophagus irregularis (strain DAOM 197198w) TaxID=1432141 RepID=A0A015IWH3_RHIIW|nr:hypothetical protein RirG_196160 [Rhizophagus irregularis DAOM 197198w]